MPISFVQVACQTRDPSFGRNFRVKRRHKVLLVTFGYPFNKTGKYIKEDKEEGEEEKKRERGEELGNRTTDVTNQKKVYLFMRWSKSVQLRKYLGGTFCLYALHHGICYISVLFI